MSSYNDYRSQEHEPDRATEERAALADRFGDELLEGDAHVRAARRRP